MSMEQRQHQIKIRIDLDCEAQKQKISRKAPTGMNPGDTLLISVLRKGTKKPEVVFRWTWQ
jgi:hypothetical protein